MKTRPGLVILWLIVLSSLGLAPDMGWAQNRQQPVDPKANEGHGPGAPAGSPANWAVQAPASADVVFVVKDAAALRSNPTGRAIHDLVSRAGLLAGTRTSWDDLANRLGWVREEAFDHLLGGQFMIIVSGVAGNIGAEPASWALLSRVNEETDKRLFERLEAAPRRVAAGHQLLSVERGEYELAVHRPRAGEGGVGGGGPDGSRLIVLGPSKRPELFDRVLRALNDEPLIGESSLFMTAAAAGVKEVGDADAIVLVRLDVDDPKKAAQAGAWAANAAFALKTDDEGVSLRCSVSDPTAAEMLDGVGGPAIDLDASFTGALIAISEHRVANVALEPVAMVLAAVRMPAPLQQALTSGQMFVAVPSPAAPGVAVGLAVHMKDPYTLAPEGDAFMAGIVRLIEGAPGVGGPAPALDFAGVAPQAVRTVPVQAWGAFPELGWPEVWLSWAYAPSDAPGAAAANADPIKIAPADPARGWWVIGAAAGTADEAGAGPALARDIGAQLRAAAPAGENGRVLSQAVLRPAALARAVWPAVPDMGNWREVCSRVSLVRWRFDAGDGGRINGMVRVDLTPAPAGSPPVPPQGGGLAR